MKNKKKISKSELTNAEKVFRKYKAIAKGLIKNGLIEDAEKLCLQLRGGYLKTLSYSNKKAYDAVKTELSQYKKESKTKNKILKKIEWNEDFNNIDVLGLIKWDWANSGYRYSKALEMLDLNVASFKGTPLDYFNYPVQLPTLPILSEEQVRQPGPHPTSPIINDAKYNEDLQKLINNSKVIYLFGTQWIENIKIPSSKRIVVQHGGITYRVAPEKCNAIYNPVVSATIAQCPDLLNLGAINEHLIYYPVETDLLTPKFDFKHSEKLVIGHFPSSPINKGTERIISVINKLKKSSLGDKFIYNGIPLSSDNKRHFVDWPQNIKRLSSSDIVIETCKPELGGKPFGEWGNTAIEASSLGTIVVTNSLTPHIYAKEYGKCALHINDGTAAGLERTLVELITSSREDIMSKKIEARSWVVRNHSLEATALRLWERVFKNFFPEKWTEESLRNHAIKNWSKDFLKEVGWI